MLHNVYFLGAQICDQTGTEDIGSSDTSLWVEELEPKMQKIDYLLPFSC